jgi:ribonuclease HI
VDLWTDGSGTTADKPGGWAFVLHSIHPATGDIFESEGSGWEPYGSNNQRRWHKVKNADIWHALIAAHARHIVTFEWVPGHSEERHNERCDELAGAARRSAPVQKQQPG